MVIKKLNILNLLHLRENFSNGMQNMYLSVILNNEASKFLFYIEIGVDFNFTRIDTNSVKYTF